MKTAIIALTAYWMLPPDLYFSNGTGWTFLGVAVTGMVLASPVVIVRWLFRKPERLHYWAVR